jgi:hypothetical protein
MKGLGDSNAERNAHKDENIAAISLTYNYKEFIMKKIISSLQARMLEFVTAGMGEPWLCI